MIDLLTLARVRFHRGTRVHAINPPGSRATVCGAYVHLEDPWGRTRDVPLPPTAQVTYPTCRKGHP